MAVMRTKSHTPRDDISLPHVVLLLHRRQSGLVFFPTHVRSGFFYQWGREEMGQQKRSASSCIGRHSLSVSRPLSLSLEPYPQPDTDVAKVRQQCLDWPEPGQVCAIHRWQHSSSSSNSSEHVQCGRGGTLRRALKVEGFHVPLVERLTHGNSNSPAALWSVRGVVALGKLVQQTAEVEPTTGPQYLRLYTQQPQKLRLPRGCFACCFDDLVS